MVDKIATEARAVASMTEESIRIVIDGVLTFGTQATQTRPHPHNQTHGEQVQTPFVQQNGEEA